MNLDPLTISAFDFLLKVIASLIVSTALVVGLFMALGTEVAPVDGKGRGE